MREVRDQLRKGVDLTTLKWQELVNVEPGGSGVAVASGHG